MPLYITKKIVCHSTSFHEYATICSTLCALPPETTRTTTQTNFITNAKPFLNKNHPNQFRTSFKISFKTNFIKELEIGIQFKNHPNHFRTSFIIFQTSFKTSFRKNTLTNSKPVLLKPDLPSTVLLQLVFIKRSFTFYLLFCNILSTVTVAISFFSWKPPWPLLPPKPIS